jgi:4-hydroxy-tetrahydrodipicolinate reductase
MAEGLRSAGHEVLGVEIGDEMPEDADAAVDFTQPDAAVANIGRCLELGVPVVVGTTGWDDERDRVDAAARDRGVAVFVAPNFSIGAVLMMRFAAEASKHLPRAEIVELHNEAKKDVPSGTAKATAAAMEGDPAIHSVRLPGLVAHQEVLLAGDGQLLTIRHDTLSRDSFVPASCSRSKSSPACARPHGLASTRSSKYAYGVLGEVLTAIVTPFKDDGSVDYESFRKLALHLVEHGSDGLVVTGTTGEGPTLSDAERMELYSTALETVGDRATVVAGTGTYSTSHSVHLTEQAHVVGVHAMLVVTPYYNKPPQRGSSSTSRPSPPQPTGR